MQKSILQKEQSMRKKEASLYSFYQYMFHELDELIINLGSSNINWTMVVLIFTAPFAMLIGLLIVLVLLPFLMIEFMIMSYKDSQCLSQADKKKIIRDHTRNILNMLPLSEDGQQKEVKPIDAL